VGCQPVDFIPDLATSFRHIQILHITSWVGHSKVQHDPRVVFPNLHTMGLFADAVEEIGRSGWSFPQLRSFALYNDHIPSNMLKSFAPDLQIFDVRGSQNNKTEGWLNQVLQAKHSFATITLSGSAQLRLARLVQCARSRLIAVPQALTCTLNYYQRLSKRSPIARSYPAWKSYPSVMYTITKTRNVYRENGTRKCVRSGYLFDVLLQSPEPGQHRLQTSPKILSVSFLSSFAHGV
jgi:hypothetical protein